MMEEDSLVKNRYYVLEEGVYWLEKQQDQFVKQFIKKLGQLHETNYFARLPQPQIEAMAIRNFTGICHRAGGAPMQGEAVKAAMEQVFRDGIALKDWEEAYTITTTTLFEIIERGLTNKPRHQEILKNKVQHVCQMFRTTAVLSYITCQAMSDTKKV